VDVVALTDRNVLDAGGGGGGLRHVVGAAAGDGVEPASGSRRVSPAPAQSGVTKAFARATALYQEALGLARRSNVSGSTLWSPNLGRNPWDHS